MHKIFLKRETSSPRKGNHYVLPQRLPHRQPSGALIASIEEEFTIELLQGRGGEL